MSPPSFSQINLLTYRPIPTPLGFKWRVASNVVNGWNSLRWSSWLIPGPMSCTITDRSVFSLAAPLLSFSYWMSTVELRATSTELPVGLYITAFESTLRSTYWYLVWSLRNLALVRDRSV